MKIRVTASFPPSRKVPSSGQIYCLTEVPISEKVYRYSANLINLRKNKPLFQLNFSFRHPQECTERLQQRPQVVPCTGKLALKN